MRKYEYSNDLVNVVKKFLVDDDWHFSFDENTGIFDFGLRVKSKIQKINYIVDVHEDVMPSTEVIKNSIHCTAAMFKRYALGIVNIIFSGCTAKEAIAKCEKSPEDERRSMISEAVGEDMEGTDIADMIERLAARLGITEDGEEESEGGSDDEGSFDDEIRINPFDGKKEEGVA